MAEFLFFGGSRVGIEARALREHANLREPPEVPSSSGETGRPSGIRLHDQGDGQRRSLISSAHSALRAVQIASRAAQSRFHNGQFCEWAFANEKSLRHRDCCGKQKVKLAETMHSTRARGVQSGAHGEFCVATVHGARFLRSSCACGRPIQRDCHSGNLRRVVVVASTAPFGPSASMLNW